MNSAARGLAVLAAIFGLIAVVLGAFAAHALKSRIEPALLLAFETGVRYQMYHALAMLLVSLWLDRTKSKLLIASGFLFSAGILFFSGSLYLLATAGWRWLGPVTPLGGLCFILGWLTLAVGLFRTRN